MSNFKHWIKRRVWIFLNIITFGLVYVWAKHKAKAKAQNINNTLTTSSNINFDIDKLINVLGGVNNIVKVDSTISTVKLDLKDTSNINQDNFKQFNIRGFIKSQVQVTIVFGDNANAIACKIKEKLPIVNVQ